MNERTAIRPQNSFNLWNLVAEGIIDENDVSLSGKIDEELLRSLEILDINSYTNQSITSSRPQTANNRRPRPPATARPRTSQTSTIQTTPRAPTRSRLIRPASTISSTYILPNMYIAAPPTPRPAIRHRRSIFRREPRVNNQETNNEEINNLETNSQEIKNEEIKNEETNNQENSSDKLYCVICLTNERKYIVTPCNHFCLCNQCSLKIRDENKCPICRKTNIKIQKVFL